MENRTLLVWEGPSAPSRSFAQAVHSLSFRLLPATSFESCLKWLDGPAPIDALVFHLDERNAARVREFQQLKKRPEMWEVPTLAILKTEALAEQRELLKQCEDFITEKTPAEEIQIRTLQLLNGTRLAPSLKPTLLPLGKIELNPKSMEARKEGKDLKLTPLEFRLLFYFLKHRGRVLSREELLRQVWDYGDISYTRTVDTFIKRLRAKLGKEGDLIETLRSVGYRLKEV